MTRRTTRVPQITVAACENGNDERKMTITSINKTIEHENNQKKIINKRKQ